MNASRPLWRHRLARALAAAFLCGPWRHAELVARGAACLGEKPPWLPIAARWTRHAFPSPPASIEPVVERLLRLPSFQLATTGRPPTPKWRKAFLYVPPDPVARFAVPPLPSDGALARWLAIPEPLLAWLADVRGLNRRTAEARLHNYHPRWLPKAHGGVRLLEEPKPLLKQAQRRILAGLLAHLPPHAAAQAFCSGRSVHSHAALHAGQAVVIRIDLADFFGSIGRARVRALFEAAGYPRPVARSLAGLCTTATPPLVVARLPRPVDAAEVPYAASQRRHLLAPHLPQGAPTSPAIANLCAWELDVRLTALATTFGARYSRYADDLTFSGGPEVARRAGHLVELAMFAAYACGFAVRHGKTRVVRSGARQVVTGLVVNERPHVARAERDQLKAILHNCVRHGPAGQNRENHPDFRAHLLGRLGWVAAGDPRHGAKLRALFDRIAW
ncbi:MAG: RNA-directed DNA polymerase [Deltaproteobacteria bacterium]|nr:RNA-directed DNA polymerase [Deltaproteobacteria bacterium]